MGVTNKTRWNYGYCSLFSNDGSYNMENCECNGHERPWLSNQRETTLPNV